MQAFPLDLKIYNFINSHIDTNVEPWKSIKMITEDPHVYMPILLVLIGTFIFCLFKYKNFHLKKIIPIVFVTILTILLSDLCSNGLKHFFGRLKPHALGQGPFSFPSSHAMNSFTLFFLAFFSVQQKKLLSKNTKALIFLFIVAASNSFLRVLLAEHYLSDLLAAFIFALPVGFLGSKLLDRMFLDQSK